MDLSFTNKVVLVTGASRGIGEAIAMGLAQAGASGCAKRATVKRFVDVI